MDSWFGAFQVPVNIKQVNAMLDFMRWEVVGSSATMYDEGYY